MRAMTQHARPAQPCLYDDGTHDYAAPGHDLCSSCEQAMAAAIARGDLEPVGQEPVALTTLLDTPEPDVDAARPAIEPYAQQIVELMLEDNASPVDVDGYLEEVRADLGAAAAALCSDLVLEAFVSLERHVDDSPEAQERHAEFRDRSSW